MLSRSLLPFERRATREFPGGIRRWNVLRNPRYHRGLSSSRATRSCSSPEPRSLESIVKSFDSSLPVEEAYTLPSSWYTSERVLDAELRTVFSDTWQYACHAASVQSPGQFCTVRIGNEPLIVARDDAGKLHCHFNVCRHHAAIVEQRDVGTASHFRCPYHGFEYALDGRLRKATQIKGIKNFSAKSFGLVKAEVQEWGPFIFVRATARTATEGDPKQSSEPLSFLEPLIDSTQGDIVSTKPQRFISRHSYAMKCNWKVAVDNYLDGGFHVPYLHFQLSDGLSLDSYKTEAFDRCSVQSVGARAMTQPQSTLPTSSDHSELDVLERIGERAYYVFIYPNLMINRYGPWTDVNIARPTGVNQCEVLFEYYLDEDTAAQKESDGTLKTFVSESLAQSDRVQQEDVQISESVQQGLKSRSYDVGRYAPRVEHAMYSFHCALADEVRQLTDLKG